MEINYVTEGLKFMLLGMTTVFLFLILLIYILKLQEKIFDKFFPHKEEKKSRSTAPVAVKGGVDEDSQVIAAITAAITDFKKR
jgi:oxaloacetate decarboxylase gamma subunit